MLIKTFPYVFFKVMGVSRDTVFKVIIHRTKFSIYTSVSNVFQILNIEFKNITSPEVSLR